MIVLGAAAVTNCLWTGKIPARGGNIYRSERPTYYWWGIYCMGAFALTGLLMALFAR